MKQPKEKPTPDEQLKKCAEMVQAALIECNCRMYTALKIGNAEAPLTEIGGLPIVVKIASNDSQT